ncbi:MAG: oxidoreductase [Candidatus Omnitrophota bacterium]
MNSMGSIKDKSVVIVGGAGLLGREFVRATAGNGVMAVLADKDVARARTFIAGFSKELRSRIMVQHVDLTSKKSLDNLIRVAKKRFGHIDAVVNAAYPRNKNYGRPFDKVTYKDFCENVDFHLGGYFLSSQVFGGYFVRHGGGHIINLGSIYGVIPPRFELYEGLSMSSPVEYAAIKAGVIHMTKYIAKFYKGKNVRANCISPGGILDKQPAVFLKRYGEQCLSKGMLDKTNINGVLLFLLSDASRFINGQNIIVDDGFTL